MKSGEGEFSLTKVGWKKYPRGPVKPAKDTVFRLRQEADQAAAKAAKQARNASLRRTFKAFFDRAWADIHEPHPVKFGGDPVGMANKEIIHPPTHWKVTKWWNELQRWIETGE